MMKTGSELISEMVGPAGSTSEGAFSRGGPTGPEDEEDEEEELCACAAACTGENAGDRHSAAATAALKKRIGENCIDETLSVSLVRQSWGVKRKRLP